MTHKVHQYGRLKQNVAAVQVGDFPALFLSFKSVDTCLY